MGLLFSATPQQSHAEEYIFQDKAVASKLYNDIETCKDNYPLLQEAVKLQREKLDGLQKDKEEYRYQRDQFEDQYKKESKARQKAEGDRPSRTTWALIGSAITAVVIGSLVAIVK